MDPKGGRLYIPRKNYQAPNPGFILDAVKKSGVENPEHIANALQTIFRKMNVDEKLNYEAIENFIGSQIVFLSGHLAGPLDAFDLPRLMAHAIEIPHHTQLLGVDWNMHAGEISAE